MKPLSSPVFRHYVFTPKMRMVETTSKGRGVIAIHPIRKGEIVEQATSFIISIGKKPKGPIVNYMYNYDIGGKTHYLGVLGFGMLYNHSKKDQNIICVANKKTGLFTYYANRNILVGEELLIEYGNNEFKD